MNQPQPHDAAPSPAPYRNLKPGDPAPLFIQKSSSNDSYHFDTAAGRYIVLCFFGRASGEHGQRALKILKSHRRLFNDTKIAFFGVSLDAQDRLQDRVKESMPGIRYIWDDDSRVSRLYGALPLEQVSREETVRLMWVVLDPSLRVLHNLPFSEDDSHVEAMAQYLKALPPVDQHAGTTLMAPALVLPRIFEPDLCRHLIDLYEKHGGEESGFMRQVGDKTVLKHDYGHKKRRDFNFSEDPDFETLRGTIQSLIVRRLVPEVQKAYQFHITRMERYIVACYDSKDGGFFKAHRDNTTLGTAHRRFACTINLNTEDYEGGDLTFPEFGTRSYRAPTGGAVIFSCSLLHEATPVTKGRRYACLPFFYDDAAKIIRDANLQYLDENTVK